MDRRIARGSQQLVGMLVEARTVAGVTRDPTAYPVEVAFIPFGTSPIESDWHAATWDSGPDGAFAVALFGAAPWDLAVGSYRQYARVTASPERPVVGSTDRIVVY